MDDERFKARLNEIAKAVHKFTRKEISECEEQFKRAIIKRFGEVWSPKSDGMYKGCAWEMRSMIPLDAGLWRLCEVAVHKGAVRAFGKIEVRESGHVVRFIIFYEPEKKDTKDLILPDF